MQNILKKIEQWAGEKIIKNTRTYGGDIAQSQILTFESGLKRFLKTGALNDNMFPTEANSLKELERSKAIRVPRVLMVEPKFLLIEYIEQGPKQSLFLKILVDNSLRCTVSPQIILACLKIILLVIHCS